MNPLEGSLPLPVTQLATIRSRSRLRKPIAFFLLLILVALSTRLHAQTAQWIKQQGTGGTSNSVSSDAAGNAYVTGTISNPGLFENITIPCHGC